MKFSWRIYFPFLPFSIFLLVGRVRGEASSKVGKEEGTTQELVPSPGLTKPRCSRKENAKQSGGEKTGGAPGTQIC